MSKNPNDLFVPTYARTGTPMVKGKGMYLWDAGGKKYLDFTSGIAVSALGHCRPELVAAAKKQAGTLLHASNLFHTQPQIDLARLLIKNSFGDRVFFCNSGTEAIEGAIKFSRKWATVQDPKKYNVLSFTDAFHGRTYGGLSATPQKKFHVGFTPMVPGFFKAPFNDVDATRKVLSKRPFAAIVVEPLQGESGINAAATDFMHFLREYTQENNIVLILDEIQCGIGRTGTFWNYEQHGIVPDVLASAKPLGGGLPLGAVICKEEIALAISPGEHGTTFGGNPIACALGAEVVRTVAKKSFLATVRKNGAYLVNSLQKLVDERDDAVGVRGAGLMVGLRMTFDPATLIAECRKNGLLLVKAGNNTVRFMPPLIVEKKDIDRAVAIFTRTLSALRP